MESKRTLDYVIVTADTASSVMEQVDSFLCSGWQLQGGVSVSLSESDDYQYIIFAQALTRVIKPPFQRVKSINMKDINAPN